MTISEVLVASSSGNSTHGSGSTIVFDTLTGTSLHQFKQNSTQDSGLIQSTRDVGGIIANVQLDKALLNIYSWQKVLALLAYNFYITILIITFKRNNYIQRLSYHKS